MSVKVRQKPCGSWEVDIHVVLPDGTRRLRDDPRGRQAGDKAPLQRRRDRIAAGGFVEIGRETEQRIVRRRLGRGVGDGGSGLASNGAGGGGAV